MEVWCIIHKQDCGSPERESRDMPAHFRRSGEQVSEFSDSHMRQRRKKGIVEGMLSVADGRTSSVGVDVEQLVFDGVLVLKNSAGTLG
jgi:hypothetical protein